MFCFQIVCRKSLKLQSIIPFMQTSKASNDSDGRFTDEKSLAFDQQIILIYIGV